MRAGGDQRIKACTRLSGTQQEYCEELIPQCAAQAKGGADFQMEVCGRVWDFTSQRLCERLIPRLIRREKGCPEKPAPIPAPSSKPLPANAQKVHGMTLITGDAEVALLKGERRALLVVGDSSDAGLATVVATLRKQYTRHALFFVSTKSRGEAYVLLARRLGVDRKLARDFVRTRETNALRFIRGRVLPEPLPIAANPSATATTQPSKPASSAKSTAKAVPVAQPKSKAEPQPKPKAEPKPKLQPKPKAEPQLRSVSTPEKKGVKAPSSRPVPETEAPTRSQRVAPARGKRRASAARSKQRVKLKLKPHVRVMTASVHTSDWRDAMHVVVVRELTKSLERTLNAIEPPMVRDKREGTVHWGRVAVIDWSDPKGRRLAHRLGIPALPPCSDRRDYMARGHFVEGRFEGDLLQKGMADLTTPSMLVRRSRKRSAEGHFRFLDEQDFDAAFGAGVPDQIVVVMDPTKPMAGAVAESLLEDRAERGVTAPYIWVPYEGVRTVDEALKRYGITGTGIWRVRSGQAKRYVPAGFATAATGPEAGALLLEGSEKVLLVVGSTQGVGAAETKTLLAALRAHQAKQPSQMFAGGKLIDRMVFMPHERVDAIFQDDKRNKRELIDAIHKDTALPQAYVWSGTGRDRDYDPVSVFTLPGGVDPVDPEEVKKRAAAKKKAEERGYGGMLSMSKRKEVNLFDGSGIKQDMRKWFSQQDASNQLTSKTMAEFIDASPIIMIYGDASFDSESGQYGDPEVGAWIEKVGRASMNQSIDHRAVLVDLARGDKGVMHLFRMESGRMLPRSPGLVTCWRPAVKTQWTCAPYELPPSAQKTKKK